MRLVPVVIGVLLTIGACPLAGQASPGFPWKSGDNPPAVAGLQLGDSLKAVEDKLGQPSDTQNLGEGVWRYTFAKKGVAIVYSKLDGTAVIDLLTAQAGTIDGIRTGDSVGVVLGRWGAPSSGQGAVGLYPAGK
jgi:hypothetical protein